MKKNYWLIAAAVVALAIPVATLDAQGGRGGGRGGRGGGAPAKPVPPPTSPVSGNPVSGKGLYFGYGCYACHGYNGETGARPFVDRWGHLGTEQEFLTFLRGRANVAPVTPATQMPNFAASSLPDKAAKDIYAYIRTFKSSAPPLKDIPTLNAIVSAAKKDHQ
jgi:mono/diheme cytochrome c family protein